MKQIITVTLLLVITLSSTITAQHISSESYNTEFIHEDFNSEGEHFKTVTTTDNYFILDKGDYLLSRNNNESEYAIIANNSSASDFVLKTAVRIGPSDNKKASIGIILKAQQGGKGAVIFEINKKREYRIKQLFGNSYQALSGNAKQEGWVKNKLVNGVDEHNFIEIRTEKNIYDVYVNSKYLTSFFVPDFTSGSCGIIISAETKARISYYYINKKGEGNPVASYTNENTASVNETIEELNKRIKLLEENNAKLNDLNSDSKVVQSEEIKDLKQKNADLAIVSIEQEKEISILKRSNTDLNEMNATLQNENKNISKLQQINIQNQKNLVTKELEIKKLILEIISKENKFSVLNNKNSELAAVTIEQEKEIKLLKGSINEIRVSENNSSASNKQLNKKITTLKQQIILEKAISTELTNDLNKTKKSSSTETNRLTAEVKTLKSKVSKLQTANTNLSTDLSNATSASATLSSDLESINTEITNLRTTQNAHYKVTSDLNSQITNLTAKIEALNSQLTTAKNTNSEFETTNAELKELFIQKDFELNGVKPSEMVKQTTTHTVQPKVLKGNNTVYSVQLGMFMQTQSQSAFKDLNSVWYQSNDNGTYQYLSGEFSSPKEAANHKSEINAKGYKNAFIVTITK
jgi:predicted RNase H-like nuclease (RuvC/YqgF family)